MKPEDFEVMEVRDEGDIEWARRVVLVQYDDGGCVAVTNGLGGDNHEAFMNGDAFDTTEWKQCRPIPQKKMRPMSRDEILAWATSKDALGWVVRYGMNGIPNPPQCVNYSHELVCYERSLASPTGDYRWERFEVEVS